MSGADDGIVWGFVRLRHVHGDGYGDGYGYGGFGYDYGEGLGNGYGSGLGRGYGRGEGTPRGYEVWRTSGGLQIECTEVCSVEHAEELLAKSVLSVWLPFVIAELEEA